MSGFDFLGHIRARMSREWDVPFESVVVEELGEEEAAEVIGEGIRLVSAEMGIPGRTGGRETHDLDSYDPGSATRLYRVTATNGQRAIVIKTSACMGGHKLHLQGYDGVWTELE